MKNPNEPIGKCDFCARPAAYTNRSQEHQFCAVHYALLMLCWQFQALGEEEDAAKRHANELLVRVQNEWESEHALDWLLLHAQGWPQHIGSLN